MGQIATFHNNYEESKIIATEIVESIGAKDSLVWIPALKNTEAISLFIEQFDRNNYDATIDLILPILPWVGNTILNSKNHIIDYTFAKSQSSL